MKTPLTVTDVVDLIKTKKYNRFSDFAHDIGQKIDTVDVFDNCIEVTFENGLVISYYEDCCVLYLEASEQVITGKMYKDFSEMIKRSHLAPVLKNRTTL